MANSTPRGASLRAQFIDEVAESTLTSQVPLAPAEKHPAVPEAAARSIEAWKRLALREVERESPLIEGEVVEDDYFSYLARRWADVPAKVPVLTRRTNLAEICYFFDCQVVTPQGLKGRAPARRSLSSRRSPSPRRRAVRGNGTQITGGRPDAPPQCGGGGA